MLTSVKTQVITTFPAGVRLRLGEAQVIHRAARLRSVGKGLYDVLDPVQFKAGEIVGLDLKLLPKELRDGLEPLKEPLKEPT